MDLGRWLHAIFTPQEAYGAQPRQSAAVAPVAPVSRAGNTYAGQSLPAGVSSLQASSEDSRGKRVRREKPSLAENPRYANAAGQWLDTLFKQTMEDFPDAKLPSDRWGDRLLDRTFFDPNDPSNIRQRRRNALDEWYRKVGKINGARGK
jgi:hypothetical protein